jgi:hypothetical protein
MVNTYYKCTVEGEYYAGTEQNSFLKNYTLDFKVPDLGADKSDLHYMSVIKKNLLLKQLKAKHQDATSFRTYEMVDRVLVDASKGTSTPAAPQAPAPKTVSSMNKTELINYIAVNNLEIDQTIYSTVDKMRYAIKSITDDSVKFLQEQADTKAEIDLQNTLNDLNPTPETPASDETPETLETNETPEGDDELVG